MQGHSAGFTHSGMLRYFTVVHSVYIFFGKEPTEKLIL
jgi:hypothetical protein